VAVAYGFGHRSRVAVKGVRTRGAGRGPHSDLTIEEMIALGDFGAAAGIMDCVVNVQVVESA
jgi:hypothetical protein